MKTLPTDAAGYEAFILANAVYFTTCLFSGVGQYNREQHATLEEARARAKERTDRQGRTAMIYAVTADGRDAMVV